jgi:hypothetical protein
MLYSMFIEGKKSTKNMILSRDAGYVYGPATPRTLFAGISLKI